jgi:hypothetical protein
MVPLKPPLYLLSLALALILPNARADIGVMIADPTDQGPSRYTDAGHALVYLSGVCPDSPIRARLCQPGEQGSVVTTYSNFHEAQPYSWNILSLSIYLQGSPNPDSRLLYASTYVKEALEDHARENSLQPVCTGDSCPPLPHSAWRNVVAVTAHRDVFVYAVHTTPAQDQLVVDYLNQKPNTNHYNGFFNNCANFTSNLLNLLFPHSTHRDLLNDVGMMGPKSAARSFSRWALRRPKLGFYSMHFAQQPGEFPRSNVARSGTETVIHMKKYLIPMILFGRWELNTSIFASYILTGRFGLYKEFSNYPTPAIVALKQDAKSAKQNDDQPLEASLQTSVQQVRTEITGSDDEWSIYRERFAEILQSTEAQNLLSPSKHSFPPQYATATAIVDRNNLPWLDFPVSPASDTTRRVGISTENILAPDSDPETAFQLMLHRVAYALQAKNHLRETMPEFRQDWSLLEQTQDRLRTTQAAALLPSHPDEDR